MTRTIIASTVLLFALGCSQQDNDAPTAAPAATAANTEAPVPMLERTESAEGARVFIISPADGDTVSNPVRVEFGIEGMDVVKAGVDEPFSGHHHLLIDTGLPDLTMPIPADEQHIHFGDGSTSTEITLPPGEHTLSMLLGDHRHIPHDPPLVSESITITVE